MKPRRRHCGGGGQEGEVRAENGSARRGRGVKGCSSEDIKRTKQQCRRDETRPARRTTDRQTGADVMCAGAPERVERLREGR